MEFLAVFAAYWIVGLLVGRLWEYTLSKKLIPYELKLPKKEDGVPLYVLSVNSWPILLAFLLLLISAIWLEKLIQK